MKDSTTFGSTYQSREQSPSVPESKADKPFIRSPSKKVPTFLLILIISSNKNTPTHFCEKESREHYKTFQDLKIFVPTATAMNEHLNISRP